MEPERSLSQTPSDKPVEPPAPMVGTVSPEPWSNFFKQNLTKILIAAGILVLLSGSIAVWANQKPKEAPESTQPEAAAQTEASAEQQQTATTKTTPTGSAAVNTPAPSTSSNNSSGSSSTPTQPPSSPPAPTPQTHHISYTNSGYSPSTLTVSKGDTVVFTNNSSSSMWPASNNHPSHNIYPEFDSDHAINQGGTYSFTFTKVGSWGFHDHLDSGEKGTITVN